MKCPKCSYISFDTPERCRNCGFDFSPAAPPLPPANDLEILAPPEGMPSDFALAANTSAAARRRPRPPGELTPADLPLFDQPVAGVDDTPLITAPSPPRMPLSVRRSTLDTPRARDASSIAAEDSEAEPFDAADDGDEGPEAVVVVPPAPPQAESDAVSPPVDHHVSGEPASIVRRLLAALYDAVLIAAIDGAVLYFTLRLTGLEPSEWVRLPLAPLIGFLAILNGGYSVAFTTASGQSIGKMLAGIRVVGEHSTRVPLGQAMVRTAAYLVSIVPAGLGFVTMLFDADRRALHDRLASTRVVRV